MPYARRPAGPGASRLPTGTSMRPRRALPPFRRTAGWNTCASGKRSCGAWSLAWCPWHAVWCSYCSCLRWPGRRRGTGLVGVGESSDGPVPVGSDGHPAAHAAVAGAGRYALAGADAPAADPVAQCGPGGAALSDAGTAERGPGLRILPAGLALRGGSAVGDRVGPDRRPP